MELHVVVLAGGPGERLWPWSRDDRPKQCLPLLPDGRTPLAATLQRASSLAPKRNLWLATRSRYARPIHAELARAGLGIDADRWIIEPFRLNTGAAIALAARRVAAAGPAVLAVLPSDHWVGDDDRWLAALRAATRLAAERPVQVTVGLPPARPDTEFGYIRCPVASPPPLEPLPCAGFVEKPDGPRAAALLEAGDCLWNSGMVVAQTGVIAALVRTYAPGLASPSWDGPPGPAWDQAILEHAPDTWVVPADFPWDDIGGWPALARLWPGDEHGNRVRGRAAVLDCRETLVVNDSPEERLLAVGLTGCVVVRSAGCVVAAPLDATRRWRDVAAAGEAPD